MSGYTPTGMLRPTGAPPAPARATERADREARASLAAGVLDARAFVEVTVPRTSVRGRMRLLTRAEAKQVRLDTRAAMAAMGLDDAAKSAAPESYREWHEELVTRTIAIAVRALDADAPLAVLEEWTACHDDQIDALWDRYRDLEHQMDPLGEERLGRLSEADVIAIRSAAKKKEMHLLVSYGSSALASYVISTADQHAS